MKKLILFLILSILLCNINKLHSQNIYDIVTYKGKIGTSDVVLKMSYAGDILLGEYYYSKFNKTISYRSEKNYVDESEIVILKEYIDNNFANYEQVIKAMEKSTGYFKFKLQDLNKYEDQKTLKGRWFSSDGKKSYEVILTKI